MAKQPRPQPRQLPKRLQLKRLPKRLLRPRLSPRLPQSLLQQKLPRMDTLKIQSPLFKLPKTVTSQPLNNSNLRMLHLNELPLSKLLSKRMLLMKTLMRLLLHQRSRSSKMQRHWRQTMLSCKKSQSSLLLMMMQKRKSLMLRKMFKNRLKMKVKLKSNNKSRIRSRSKSRTRSRLRMTKLLLRKTKNPKVSVMMSP